jgi:hypothetical protein
LLAGVSGTPTVHCFKDKDRVENISGVKMKSEWRNIFSKYIQPDDASSADSVGDVAKAEKDQVAA